MYKQQKKKKKQNGSIQRNLTLLENEKAEARRKLEELKMKKQQLQKKYQTLVNKKNANLADLKLGNEKILHVEGTRIYIRPLDIRMVNTKKEGQRVGIFGMTGSGKSVVALSIMEANKHIPFWQIHSSSESRNHQYGRHMENDLTIFEELNIEALEACKERQKIVCREWEIPNTDPVQYKYDPSIGIIIDDVAEDEKILRTEKIFSYLHCISRHDKILFIELYQYYTQLIAKFRRQLSWVFIMRPVSENDVKTMHKEFFAMFTYSEFKNLINLATRNHGCLVLHVLSDSSNIEDRVFYYRAPYPVPKFKVGTRCSRKLYKYFYDENWEHTRESEQQKLEAEIAQIMEWQKEINDLESELKRDEKLLKEFEKEKRAASKTKEIVLLNNSEKSDVEKKEKKRKRKAKEDNNKGTNLENSLDHKKIKTITTTIDTTTVNNDNDKFTTSSSLINQNNLSNLNINNETKQYIEKLDNI